MRFRRIDSFRVIPSPEHHSTFCKDFLPRQCHCHVTPLSHDTVSVIRHCCHMTLSGVIFHFVTLVLSHDTSVVRHSTLSCNWGHIRRCVITRRHIRSADDASVLSILPQLAPPQPNPKVDSAHFAVSFLSSSRFTLLAVGRWSLWSRRNLGSRV